MLFHPNLSAHAGFVIRGFEMFRFVAVGIVLGTVSHQMGLWVAIMGHAIANIGSALIYLITTSPEDDSAAAQWSADPHAVEGLEDGVHLTTAEGANVHQTRDQMTDTVKAFLERMDLPGMSTTQANFMQRSPRGKQGRPQDVGGGVAFPALVDALIKTSLNPGLNHLVGFLKSVAALRMAHNHPVTTKLF